MDKISTPSSECQKENFWTKIIFLNFKTILGRWSYTGNPLMILTATTGLWGIQQRLWSKCNEVQILYPQKPTIQWRWYTLETHSIVNRFIGELNRRFIRISSSTNLNVTGDRPWEPLASNLLSGFLFHGLQTNGSQTQGSSLIKKEFIIQEN